LHSGWHDNPLDRVEVQLPTRPLDGATDASHGSGRHSAAVRLPSKQLDTPDAVYPVLHSGWHDDPLDRVEAQSPTRPFDGATDASHESGRHWAAVRSPAKQLEGPDTVWPLLHSGWHEEPLNRVEVQLPSRPLDGALDASHGSGRHSAAVRLPSKQLDAPDAV